MPVMPRSVLSRWLFAAVPAALVWAAPAFAADPTHAELREVAKQIAGFLKLRDAAAVTLEPFASRDATPSNAGPGLCQALREELSDIGVAIDPKAPFKVKGVY